MASNFWSKALVAFPATAFGLGLWQVYRLQWKLGLIEDREAQFRRPPIDFPSNPSPEELQKLEFSTVKLTGTFQHDKEIYMTPRWGRLATSTSPQEVGAHVLTPLVRPDGERILVNRGWVPLAKRDPLTRPEGQISGEVAVRALVRPGDREKPNYFAPDNVPERKEWHWLDLSALAKAADTKPILVDALPEPANPGGLPVGGTTPVALKNDHLGYALTWFSLAFITSFAILRYRKRPDQKTLLSLLR